MSYLFGLVFLIGLPFGIAWAIASTLPEFAPKLSRRTRIVVSAMAAGLVPVLLPIAAVALTAPADSEMAIPIAALLFMGLLLGVIIGLPVAVMATRRKDPHRPLDQIFK